MSLPCIVQVLCMTWYIQVNHLRILVILVRRTNRQKEYCLSVTQNLTSSTIDQHFGFPFVSVWMCDFARSFLLPHGLVIRCFSMNVTLLSPRHTSQEQVTHPHVISATNEVISDSVELCETELCFLHIKLTGTKCFASEDT